MNPKTFSVAFPPKKMFLFLVDSSPNCRHKLIVPSDGWRSARERSACHWPPIVIASFLSFCSHCHLIVVIPSSLLSLTTSMLTLLSLSFCCCHLCRIPLPHHRCRHRRHRCRWHRCHRCHRCHQHRRIVGMLVVLLGCQSKEFDGVPPLGFAVGLPTALLGRHLVKDVVLSEISWC